MLKCRLICAQGVALFESFVQLDSLEATEKDSAHHKALAESALRVAKGWEDKCDELRAKIAEMEKQEPVAWQTRTRPAWNDGTWGPWRKCSEEYAEDIKKTPLLHDWLYEARALYTLPGTQSATSVPSGWLRAIDEALVIAHIGVANAEDTYEQAKTKLDNLIGFHVEVATDPAVNGGYKLMPIEPTQEMVNHVIHERLGAFVAGKDHTFIDIYKAMLSAAPEAKP